MESATTEAEIASTATSESDTAGTGATSIILESDTTGTSEQGKYLRIIVLPLPSPRDLPPNTKALALFKYTVLGSNARRLF